MSIWFSLVIMGLGTLAAWIEKKDANTTGSDDNFARWLKAAVLVIQAYITNPTGFNLDAAQAAALKSPLVALPISTWHGQKGYSGASFAHLK